MQLITTIGYEEEKTEGVNCIKCAVTILDLGAVKGGRSQPSGQHRHHARIDYQLGNNSWEFDSDMYVTFV